MPSKSISWALVQLAANNPQLSSNTWFGMLLLIVSYPAEQPHVWCAHSHRKGTLALLGHSRTVWGAQDGGNGSEQERWWEEGSLCQSTYWEFGNWFPVNSRGINLIFVQKEEDVYSGNGNIRVVKASKPFCCKEEGRILTQQCICANTSQHQPQRQQQVRASSQSHQGARGAAPLIPSVKKSATGCLQSQQETLAFDLEEGSNIRGSGTPGYVCILQIFSHFYLLRLKVKSLSLFKGQPGQLSSHAGLWMPCHPHQRGFPGKQSHIKVTSGRDSTFLPWGHAFWKHL